MDSSQIEFIVCMAFIYFLLICLIICVYIIFKFKILSNGKDVVIRRFELTVSHLRALLHFAWRAQALHNPLEAANDPEPSDAGYSSMDEEEQV